jgi:hypothetical protein
MAADFMGSIFAVSSDQTAVANEDDISTDELTCRTYLPFLS